MANVGDIAILWPESERNKTRLEKMTAHLFVENQEPFKKPYGGAKHVPRLSDFGKSVLVDSYALWDGFVWCKIPATTRFRRAMVHESDLRVVGSVK